MPQAEFIALVRGAEERVITSDETVIAFLAQAGVAAELIVRPSAALIAQIAAYKLHAGITVAPELLDANYIRRSDAEIFSAPKLGITTGNK